MHNLASNNRHGHRSVFTGTVVSSEPKALWVVVIYTMNNYTYNTMRVCDSIDNRDSIWIGNVVIYEYYARSVSPYTNSVLLPSG